MYVYPPTNRHVVGGFLTPTKTDNNAVQTTTIKIIAITAFSVLHVI